MDEAFRFLCESGAGGDFLVLRAAGDDDYNSYINSPLIPLSLKLAASMQDEFGCDTGDPES